MKFPDSQSITSYTYEGKNDSTGLPHGYGVMEFTAKMGRSQKEYKYEGSFKHGKRHGFGTIYIAVKVLNPYEEWEWYQIGDYDAAGRLIHPEHEPGSYSKYINEYIPKFSGWWLDDNPLEFPKSKDMTIPDFEITQDAEFLKRFYDLRDVRRLSENMVEKLRNSEDPYGKFGYGQWLLSSRSDIESRKSAVACFKFAADNGIVDATHMLSKMYAQGNVYNESKGIWMMEPMLAHILNAGAAADGSELAQINKNCDLFYGTTLFPAKRAEAIAEAEERVKNPDSSILWTEQLGWFYDEEERYDEAWELYEKCIEKGLMYPIYSLAFIAHSQGNTELMQRILNAGINYNVPSCMILGIEMEGSWDDLSESEQREIHKTLKRNLERGIQGGDGFCAYVLSLYTMHGLMGFKVDREKSMRTALKGIDLNNSICYGLAFRNALNDMEERRLPKDLQLTDEEIILLALRGLRRGDNDDMLDYVISCRENLEEMGYGKEIEDTWYPKWEEAHKDDAEDEDEDDDEGEENGESEDIEKSFPEEDLPTKTEITPTVLIINPSGFVDFVEADVNPMSFREMGELIGAESIDAIHFSAPLSKITKECKLIGRNVTMYVDREGIAKNLEDNMVATLLYGGHSEIRGAVIIAMEDSRYDTYSFDTEEDIENVYDAIENLTGLVRRDYGDDDGRYDAWA